MLGPAHGRGRVRGHDLTYDEPVEQLPEGGELLLHARRRDVFQQSLDIRDNVKGSDSGQRQVARLTPSEESQASSRIGPARVRVAEVGPEEFDVAADCGLASFGNEGCPQR